MSGSGRKTKNEDTKGVIELKALIIWILVIITLIVAYGLLTRDQMQKMNLKYGDFLDRISKGEIKSITFSGYEIEGEFHNSHKFKSTSPTTEYGDLIKWARQKGIIIEAKKPKQQSFFSILIFALPFVLLLVFIVIFLRQMQSGSSKAISFGKSRAKLFGENQKKVTFNDVAGAEEAKEELKEVIEYLKNPGKFKKLGGKIPKGILLEGSPGTGKTLLAKAIAGEASVPFFSVSGSDFVEMFVGVGASRVRDLFDQGKKNAPCIIFIDEIDAVGRHRGIVIGGGQEEREQTLNQLLFEMDGFESNEGIIVVAATNRPDVLDHALLRPGRFDRRIEVTMPDVRGREGILKVHIRQVPLDEKVDLTIIARGTPGFSGADLANLVNEAALNAARYNRKKVLQEDFEFAKDKVMMGTERKTMVINDAERKIVAYHEAGHAIVAYKIPEADPIHKVTIIPRGKAIGLTQQIPLDDKYNYSKQYLLALISVLLGGRISEELFLGQMTTGAANDLERATELARRMVCEWGMSETFGPLAFGKNEDETPMSSDHHFKRIYSQATAQKIDKEIKKIIEESYGRAKNIIEEAREKVILIAENLLEREVLDAGQIKMLCENGALADLIKDSESAAEEKNEKEMPINPVLTLNEN
ncbi:MAG: cell division protein FtsH [Candidatus Fischerbacteria bacterium RBG_13_37_8]|uniref:ATP-dependent zinc metalloprotease FtsH n=1 Tax=Candidatus Fischerbacteria bacterium RBG_13_37_8 TaxID=1817863 RepID=A0A1F5V5P8_9BACT|nr:MAG: cell division protein FtsH [Candidatus Fischerbacteria bacterium RBG_13_37_8]